MPEEQESEELLSDIQDLALEGSMEAAIQLQTDVTSTPETESKLEGTSTQRVRRITFQNFSNLPSILVKIRRSWLFEEMVEIIKLAVPIFLMYFFQQLLFFLSLLLVGHSTSHSKTELDAAALANSVVNVSGLSVVVGLTSAADTLCPQAFGFKNYRKVGIILQRGILIVCLICLPIAALWLNTESILLLLHQPPCVARLTGQFVQIFILALLPMGVYVMIQKYLQAQSLVWVFVVVGIFQNIINVLVAALFIYVGDIVIVGASISLVVSYVVVPCIIIGYVWGRGLHKQTWKGWSWDSLTEWSLFFKLGIPGLLMVCFEWWTFEISTIVAGAVDELQLAVNTVLMQFGMINFAIPLGLGTAASVRVGNELGAGNPQKAKRAAFAALVVQGIVALVLLIIFAGSRTVIAGVFTSEQDVIEETAKAMIPGTAVLFLDQFQGTFAGIIRGSGRQKIGAILNFAFYYLIGLPVGISLALLTDLGATGMWTGLCIAVFLTDCTYVVIMLTTNWKKISEWAMKNAVDHSEPNLSTSTEKINDTSEDTNSESSSVVSMETATIELDAESAAATLLNHVEDKEKEYLSNGNITITEEEELPLISFEDPDLLDPAASSKPHHPPHASIKERSRELFRKRLKLLLVKGLFFGLGAVLFAAGCILVVTFRHGDVDEMCTLDDELTANVTFTASVLPSSVVFTSALPSPTSTLTDHFRTLGDFTSSIF